MRRYVVLCAASLLAACTTTNVGTDRLAERDPLEKVNRPIWGFNQAVDKVALKPASTVYRTITPPPLRRGLSRVLANFSEPWSAINNVLQGKMKRAGHNLARFAINTTIGVGGLADQASKMGIPRADEDFGQTLAAWGMNGGPYLMLPLLGPSTLRDGVGSVAAFGGDPYRIALREYTSTAVQWGETGLEFVSARAELTETGGDAFLKTSLDPYAAARSAYLQRRRTQILNQEDSADAGAADTDAADTGAATPTDDAAAPPPTVDGSAPVTGAGQPATATSPAPTGAAPADGAAPAAGDSATGDSATPAASQPSE